MRRLLLIPLALAACGGERNPENSASCGLAAVAGAAIIKNQFEAASTLLSTPPKELVGTVPARIVGRGTTRALAARTDDGVVLGFEGEGFPTVPGFAIALVDDSLESFKGVLIFETEGPADYPRLGTVSSSSSTIPLYGMRIGWGRVSNDRCPLFAPLRDSTATR